MGGTISLEGKSGEWNFYNTDSASEPALVIEWNITGEESRSLTISGGFESGGSLTIQYTEDGTGREFIYSVFLIGGLATTTISWDSDLNTGYIDHNPGTRICWNEDLEDTQCSDL